MLPRVLGAGSGSLRALVAVFLTIAAVVSAGTRISLAADTHDRSQAVSLKLPEVTVAAPGTDAPLAVTVTPASAVPPKSYLRIRGIPASVTLTEGHNIAAGAWAVPLAGLPSLAMRIPKGLSGKAEIHASLVGLDGNVIDEVRATIVIGPTGLLTATSNDPDASIAAPATATPSSEAALHAPASGGGVHSGAPETATDATHHTLGATVSSFPPQTLSSVTKSAPAPKPEASGSTRDARAVMARGEKQLAAHDLPGARTLFERAADLGLGEAAMQLAATYDPNELKSKRPAGASPDVKLAHKWYTRAQALGVREAKSRLQRLATR
jgi:hypothetical protein